MRRAPPAPDPGSDFTSLIDVAVLLIVFFMALPMRRLDQKIEAYLPREDGGRPIPMKPKDTVRILVRQRGEGLTYVLGDRAADSPQALRPTLRKLGPGNLYEIDATAKVPWQGVVSVVDVLREVGCEEIRFRGGPPPGFDIRRR
jgi:biopolymer transport protein ExbD